MKKQRRKSKKRINILEYTFEQSALDAQYDEKLFEEVYLTLKQNIDKIFAEHNIKSTDENIIFYLDASDKEMALHILKSTQDN